MRSKINENEQSMVKIKIPLPENDPSGGEAEWVWADRAGKHRFVIRNVPTFAFGLSYGDTVKAKQKDGVLVFDEVVQRGGHSTYRVYATSSRKSPEVVAMLETLEKMHCEIETATDKIVGVDVLPEADIYKVYKVLEEAEHAGSLQFEEGHCGHPLRA
jgi:hypothetical protein